MPRKTPLTRPSSASTRTSSRVRIIGGQWRGQLLTFADLPGLRPTGDRIRETLFNWLQFSIAGRHCLDLFAGSGVLGVEAVSRGASSATLVDSHTDVVNSLRSHVAKLDTDKLRIVHAQALDFVLGDKAQWGREGGFDLVFIDPPFARNSQLETLQACVDSGILNQGAIIYLEAPLLKASEPSLEDTILNTFAGRVVVDKSKSAGQVQYLLLTYQG